MSRDSIPDDFDWVLAQSQCTSASMFDGLRTSVKEDVERRNGVLDPNAGWAFEFQEDGDDFEAVRLASGGSKVLALVRFERNGRRIEIHGEDVDVDFTAIVTVDTSGLCRFVVGEVMYSGWEIRRMALEALFFDEPEDYEDDE